jgi:hypothetical protein
MLGYASHGGGAEAEPPTAKHASTFLRSRLAASWTTHYASDLRLRRGFQPAAARGLRCPRTPETPQRLPTFLALLREVGFDVSGGVIAVGMFGVGVRAVAERTSG